MSPSAARASGPFAWAPLAWTLLAHEWRLVWRGLARVGGGKDHANARVRWPRLALPVALQCVLHALGLFALALPRQWQDTSQFRTAAALVLVLLCTFMLSFAMSRVVSAFHERDDLDFLFAAPIPPALILFVRMVATAATTWAAFAFFVYPVVDVAVVGGRFWAAWIYALLALVAILATAVALFVTDAVVRLLGTRRARVALQVFSALTGAAFYLVTQAGQFLPDAWRLRAWSLLHAWADGDSSSARFIGALGRGDPATWAGLAVVSIAAFVVALVLARRRFADLARMPAATSGAVRATPARMRARIDRGFTRGLVATLMVKEWRLILRAPQLLSQVLLQLLYLVPLVFFAFGRRDVGIVDWGGAAHAAAVIGLACTLATSLAWLSVSAEDAPDLIAGSPRPRGRILVAKLLAATLPPYALVLVAALESLRRSSLDAVVLVVYGALACASAALLSAAAPMHAKRSDFQRRHRGRGLIALVEGFEFLLWAAAAGAMASGHWILALSLTVVASIWPAMQLGVARRNLSAVAF